MVGKGEEFALLKGRFKKILNPSLKKLLFQAKISKGFFKMTKGFPYEIFIV
jgi:hypothetical protein